VKKVHWWLTERVDVDMLVVEGHECLVKKPLECIVTCSFVYKKCTKNGLDNIPECLKYVTFCFYKLALLPLEGPGRANIALVGNDS
jgi:hypothetical protein